MYQTRENYYRSTHLYTCSNLFGIINMIIITYYPNRTYTSSVLTKSLYKYYVSGSTVRSHPSLHTGSCTDLTYPSRSYLYYSTSIDMVTCPVSLTHAIENPYQCANDVNIPTILLYSVQKAVLHKPPFSCTKCGRSLHSKFHVCLVVLLPDMIELLNASVTYYNSELYFMIYTKTEPNNHLYCPVCVNCAQFCYLAYVVIYPINDCNTIYVQPFLTVNSVREYLKLTYMYYMSRVKLSILTIIDNTYNMLYLPPIVNINLYLKVLNMLNSLDGILSLYLNTNQNHLISLPYIIHIIFNLYATLINTFITNFETYCIPICLKPAELFTFPLILSKTNAKGTIIYLTYISNG